MDSFEEKVAEVISNLSDDDDFLESVKESIDISSFVKDAIGQNKEVRKTLIDLLIDYIKNIDLSDYEIGHEIVGTVSIKDLIESDEEITEAIKEKVRELAKNGIENWDDESSAGETITEELDVDKKLIKEIIKEDDIQEKLREKIKELITNEIDFWGSDDQDSDDLDSLMEPIRENLTISDDLVQEIVQDRDTQRTFEEKIKQLVANTIKNIAEKKEGLIEDMISGDQTLNQIISDAISQAAKSRDTEQVIRNTVSQIIKTKFDLNNILSQGISKVISERLVEGILRISFSDKR